MSRHETIIQYAKTLLLAAILILAVWSFGSHQPKVEAQGGAGAGYSYTHITTATNTLVKSANGTLHAVVINGGTAGAVTVFDANTGACTGGTTIGIIATSTVSSESLNYDIQALNGICLTTAAATDVTVTWR
jgi:hypothetical protein